MDLYLGRLARMMQTWQELFLYARAIAALKCPARSQQLEGTIGGKLFILDVQLIGLLHVSRSNIDEDVLKDVCLYRILFLPSILGKCNSAAV